MKNRYVMPLLAHLAAVLILVLVVFQDHYIFFLMAFVASFPMMYFGGVTQTLKNKTPVVKLRVRAPMYLPIMFYLIPVVVIGLLILPDSSARQQFFGLLGIATMSYTIGVLLLFLDLKHDYRRQSTAHAERGTHSPEGKKKLLLINPVNPSKAGLSINPSSTFPPLGLGIIAALTPDEFWVKLIDENLEPFRYEAADLVGITAFTAAAPRAYEIAEQYRENNVPVVMGGIHASMRPNEAKEHVASVVIGEAESVWPQVIHDFLQGELKKEYHGVHLDLKGATVPDRSLFSPKYMFATIQTSRGCPMDCEFCSVSAFNGKRFRQRPVEDVLDELEQIPDDFIFFVDDNIIGYGKKAEKRAIKLFKGMGDRKLNKTWFCQASLNFGSNDEVLEWAARAGCRMVFLGLESPDPEELKQMNKNLNVQLAYEKAFERINDHGIAVLGAFIFGSLTETKENMWRKVDYILDNRVDVIQTTLLTPLPGTRLFNTLQQANKLIYTDFPKDWERYDMTELCFTLKNMSIQEFLVTLVKCQKKLFSRRSLSKKFYDTWRHTKSMEAALWARSSNESYRNVGRALMK